MKYLFACGTDRGTGGRVNQDALLVRQAVWKGEQVLLAVLCDGMGGLKKGEVASGSVIQAFFRWFGQELPGILTEEERGEQVTASWEVLLQDMNEQIRRYGEEERLQLGTTVTAMLFVEEQYYMVHVGDGRAYELTGQIRQLTRDQTLVEREVDRKILTREQAERDPRRNILLQCVGVSEEVAPAYGTGMVRPDTVYVLCSDGFRHVLGSREILGALRPDQMTEEQRMEKQIQELITRNRSRGEQDDISAIVIRTV